jgi:hypothetical protein
VRHDVGNRGQTRRSADDARTGAFADGFRNSSIHLNQLRTTAQSALMPAARIELALAAANYRVGPCVEMRGAEAFERGSRSRASSLNIRSYNQANSKA